MLVQHAPRCKGSAGNDALFKRGGVPRSRRGACVRRGIERTFGTIFGTCGRRAMRNAERRCRKWQLSRYEMVLGGRIGRRRG